MWQLKIEDPSGETRIIKLHALKRSFRIGKNEDYEISLRDMSISGDAALIWIPNPEVPTGTSPYWIRCSETMATIYLGDLAIREAQLIPGLPVKIGESVIRLERVTQALLLPQQPAKIRPWLTQSSSGKELLWNLKKSSATPLSVYLAGETGTGKEVLAHLLHAWSDRASGPFVPLHCAALPLSLIESELFGHVKGAFTGAIHHRAGALFQAHGGTLFLDEIGDLPLDIQVKLLRFLEDGEIKPVGSDHTVHANVRLVCATHQPLQKLVEDGKFRRDLYYRVASITVEIPPLRMRPDDIQMLAMKFAEDLGKKISHRALFKLKTHAWPGNVRELRHAVERACGLAGPFVPILSEDIFDFLVTSAALKKTPQLGAEPATLTLREMERAMILRALKLSRGNRAKAAEILGVARSTFFEMLKRYKIPGLKKSEEKLRAIEEIAC